MANDDDGPTRAVGETNSTSEVQEGQNQTLPTRRLFTQEDVATIKTACSSFITAACERPLEAPNVEKSNVAVMMRDYLHLLSKYSATKIAEKLRQLMAVERKKVFKIAN